MIKHFFPFILIFLAGQVLAVENSLHVKKFCRQIETQFKKYNWGPSSCDDFTWNHVRNSAKGNPIIWYVFGEENHSKNPHTVTVIMCGVHGDEITPIKFCFDVMSDLHKNPLLYKDKTVVVAPLVSPDSFLTPKPTRTNSRGVDVNRNFPTKDWNKDALAIWKNKFGKDKRRFPGHKPLSEQETIFQVNLINRYLPNKIISVHSPLQLLDYDGPNLKLETGQKSKDLLISMSNKAESYKISDYPFFPGSLGNWAGQEKDIPTYTLELPNSDWNKTDKYFKLFQEAIHLAIQDDLKVTPETASSPVPLPKSK